jgi:Flp pilus assembly protein TadD
MAVQEADSMEKSGNFRGALNKLNYASEVVDTVKRRFPDWSPEIVSFRKQRISEAISRVSDKAGKASSSPVDSSLQLPDDPLGEPIPGPTDPPPMRPVPLPSGPRKTMQVRPKDPEPTAGLQDAIKNFEKMQADLKDAQAAARRAEQDKSQLADKLDQAIKAREDAEKQKGILQTRADNAEERLRKEQAQTKVDTEKVKALQAEALEARRLIKARQIDEEAEMEVRKQLNDRLQAAQARAAKLLAERDTLQKANKDVPQKIQQLQAQLDKANQEKTELTQQLADTKTKLQQMTGQRDDALKQLAQLKEAAKNVDKLVTENAALMARVQDAEKQVAAFKAEGEEKDKQIAALKKEVGSVKEQLAQVRTESANYQRQLGDMQAKLDEQSKLLAQAKAETAASNADKKKMVAENEILRGIVLRQQQQEARRSATKKIVLGELAKLEIKSKTLMKDIEFLSQPVVKLSAKELSLFKNSSNNLMISEGGDISASKPTSDDPALPTDTTNEVPAMPEPKQPETPAEKPTITLDPPAIDPGAPIASLPSGLPPETPSETLPKTGSVTDPGVKDGENAPADGNTLGSGNTPNIPAEFLTQARDGKELFEKGDYRGAEKIYEKILAKVPNNLYILSNLGVVRFRAGKYKQAEEVLLKATKVAPEDSFSHCTLGIVYYTEQKLDEAVSSLGRALAINPKNATAHNYLGITAASKGWPESAQKELETACSIDPRYADAHFNLAVVFATQTPPNKEKARQYYKRATELGAESDSALEGILK